MVDPRKKINFKHEVSNLAELDHMGVIKLHQQLEDNLRIYLIMEYGGIHNLKEFIKSRPSGKLTSHESKILFGHIVRSVNHIHSKGIVHRDIKLQNIVLRTIDSPKMVDFGFSRKGLFTTFDDSCGTPSYMSPELLGYRKPKKAIYSDIWALGVILYYIMAHEYPFRGRKNIIH